MARLRPEFITRDSYHPLDLALKDRGIQCLPEKPSSFRRKLLERWKGCHLDGNALKELCSFWPPGIPVLPPEIIQKHIKPYLGPPRYCYLLFTTLPAKYGKARLILPEKPRTHGELIDIIEIICGVPAPGSWRICIMDIDVTWGSKWNIIYTGSVEEWITMAHEPIDIGTDVLEIQLISFPKMKNGPSPPTPWMTESTNLVIDLVANVPREAREVTNTGRFEAIERLYISGGWAIGLAVFMFIFIVFLLML